jgi:hypothetical protein
MNRKSLILGANRFNLLTQYEVDNLLNSALELGIQRIDTAPSYRTSEKKIGSFLKRNPGTFQVSTKIFRDQNKIDVKIGQKSLERSMDRLNISKINCLYIHGTHLNPVDFLLIETMKSFQRELLVDKIGWCGYVSSDINNPFGIYESLMIRVNPWDRTIEQRADLLSVPELVGMNIFANGFWDYKEWGRLKTLMSAYLFRRFNPYPGFYLSHSESIHLRPYEDFQNLISFAESREYLDAIVIGTLNDAHLRQIVAWVSELENPQ